MLFNSPSYLFIFLPLVLLVYYALTHCQNIVYSKVCLVVASLVFYCYWSPVYLILICGSITINYAFGLALNRLKQVSFLGIQAISFRKLILALGVSFNLILLTYFKYADFFLQSLGAIIGTEYDLLNLVLPLAISFFSFQQIAYLVDSYRENTLEYRFLDYCLFVSFFPQLIAGPIVHHQEMMPQFMSNKNRFINWSNISVGVFIFSIGLFKKTIIADSFAIWADAGFDTSYTLGLFDAWATSLSYTFQLYYDFSGYTDMAIGAALLFNIRLPMNFNSPYKAVNIQDFWRRWHITLSRWLRDYVYIPLGGNRNGQIWTYQNMFLTFLLGGLWHGAAWTFVIWGALHGLAVVVHRISNNRGIVMPVLVGWFLTFMFINSSWVFFRAESFGSAFNILKGMVGLNGLDSLLTESVKFNFPTLWPLIEWTVFFPFSAAVMELSIFIVGIAFITFLAPNSMQMSGFVAYRRRIQFQPRSIWAWLTGLAFAISVSTFLGSTSPSEFLYFNF